MHKKIIHFVCTLVLGLAPLVTPTPASAAVQEGVVVKEHNGSALYYINQGGRFVFPNEATYRSWYPDFSQVTEVPLGGLTQYPLRGNVRYRPGVLMVKIQTDPRVYAVGGNGVLHWLTTEALAKKLYGDNWNLLIDDVPDTFFINYTVGDPVDEEDEYDPEDEATAIATIAQDRIALMQLRLTKKIAQTTERLCARYERQVNHIQKRLARRGITLTNVGSEYLSLCVDHDPGSGDDDDDDDDDDEDDEDDDDDKPGKGRKKVKLCHIPPGSPQTPQTITVGAPAARAHLAHGDILGACPGSTTPDTTAPVITGLTASPSTTSVLINWQTNEPADGMVTYATSSAALASSTAAVNAAAFVTNHSLTLPSLTPSTTYYYFARSRDVQGNSATSSPQTFTTLAPVLVDTTPPVISSLTATPSTTSAIISWTTNEPSTSLVTYATSTLATATTTLLINAPALVLSHSLTLPSLTASTTYFYLAHSADGSGNAATSTEQTFVTAP